MKWFKHFTDWRHDSDIRSAMNLYNNIGYSFYLMLKEVYGEHFNDCDENGYLKYDRAILMEDLKVKTAKLIDLFEFYKNRNRLEYKVEKEFITFKIPEFIRLADNWKIRKELNNCKIFANNQGTEERRKEENEERRKEEETDIFIFDISRKILDDLNAKTKKNFSDRSFIIQQIRNGKKPEDFFTIIDNKLNDPFFQKNTKLYNPKTLFGDEHFDTYLNEKTKPVIPEENEVHLFERKETNESERENTPYATIRKIYKTYLDTELSATQESLHYIIHNIDIDDAMQENDLNDILDEISAVSIGEKITLFMENTLGLKERRFWNLLEEKTEKECEWQNEVPEEFLKSEFFEFYKNKERED